MLVLPPKITHDQAAAALQRLLQGMADLRAPQVVVDATALAVFDSSALAVLLECRREALRRQQSFAVQGLHPRLVALAGLYGVAALLPAAAA
ncbi:MAG: STAS domain-containing protein [Burkholderiaceae bacterium]|nr:STAS domain-containing protein [Burkholderiaceae bacterium]